MSELTKDLARPRLVFLALLLLPAALACNLSLRDDVHWYVATDGDDRNSCLSVDEPCQTIGEALERATDDDVINIAAGTYRSPHAPADRLAIHKSVTLIGAGREDTVLDFEDADFGVYIQGEHRVAFRRLTIHSVAGMDGSMAGNGNCVFATTPVVSLRFDEVEIRDCSLTGLTIHDPAKVVAVTITDSRVVDNGGRGIVQYWGSLDISGSVISGNERRGMEVSNVVLNMFETTVERNRGGLQIYGGEAQIISSNFLDNFNSTADGYGEILGSTIAFPIPAIRVDISSTRPVILIEGTRIARNLDGVLLSLRDSTSQIRSSQIEENARSGFVLNGETVLMTDVLVRGNGSPEVPLDPENTGGVTVKNGRLEVFRSEIEGNYGGMYVNRWSTALIDHSTVNLNQSERNGGIANEGEIEIRHSTVTENRRVAPADSLQVGGILNLGLLRMYNSTVSGNKGAGVFNSGAVRVGQVELQHVTIVDNEGLGLVLRDSDPGLISAQNSLIARNLGDCDFDMAFDLNAPGANIDSDGSCGATFSFPVTELALGPLQNNGGHTHTHALNAGSRAIDAAADRFCPGNDQRDEVRPGGLACDVGAYEVPLFTLPVGPPGESPAVPSRPTANTVTLCLEGPGVEYATVSSVQSGTEVDLLGVGAAAGWLVIDSPRFPGVACWVAQEDFDLDPALDLAALPRFDVPPPPTPTPTLLTPPDAPTNLQIDFFDCSQNGYFLPLTWADNAEDESGYRVLRDGQTIATLGPGAESYTDEAPNFGMAYEYAVEAFNEVGASAQAGVDAPGCLP